MARGYTVSGIVRALVLATMVAGTLDILAAFLYAGIDGTSPASVLRAVASGVIGRPGAESPVSTGLGLLLHFVLMAAFANLYLIVASRVPEINRMPVISGIVFGLLVWLLMYHVVLPLRWPGVYPLNARGQVVRQLIAHVLLVGLPIALIARSAAFWGTNTVENDTQ